jgi:hypothetical protein
MEPDIANLPISPGVPAGPQAPAGMGELQPEGGPAPLTFSPDQIQALIGSPPQPGQEYTVTFRAGEIGPDGGVQVEVVQSPMEEAAEGPSSNPAEESVESDPPEVTEALGYDRSALMKERKKTSFPSGSGKDLEDD